MSETSVTPAELADAFGLSSIEPESLSPWAVVHEARLADDSRVVIKRTAPTELRATAMARWTASLAASGVGIVTPIAAMSPNPRPVGDAWWVAYPYVDGMAYDGGPAAAHAAGDLLGRLHRGDGPTHGLRTYDFADTDEGDMEGDLVTLGTILRDHGAGHLAANVEDLGRRWWRASLPALRAEYETLPRCVVTSDYKSANLVYAKQGPVLVDPDNGGVEPRLFELAFAALMFHHESPAAPSRLFDDAEWEAFATAYAQHVRLTPDEHRLWPAALDHMWWEEGTWALEDADADAWDDPRQEGVLLALAGADPELFPLP